MTDVKDQPTNSGAAADSAVTMMAASPPDAPAVESAKPGNAAAIAPDVKPSARAAFAMPEIKFPTLRLPAFSRRAKRTALLATTVVLAAGFGAVAGAMVVSATAPAVPPPDTVARAADERDAMQKTIARLGKEIATLKTSVDAASKNATSQIAKLNDRVNEKAVEARRAAASPETTGSIPSSVPVPAPRPAVAAEQKPAVVSGWLVRDGRDGVALVESRGEVFEVVPGAPLPGLGRVELIRRQDGRWVVVTPKGLIVSTRPRGPYDRY